MTTETAFGSMTTNELYWIFSDHLQSSSVILEEDESIRRIDFKAFERIAQTPGDVYSRTIYTAFGEERDTVGSSPTDYTYTGQRSYTDDFGLMFYNARWYDPVLAHFSQADTIVPRPGNSGDWDRYAYVLNNPMNMVDPSGHSYSGDDEWDELYNQKSSDDSITLFEDDDDGLDELLVKFDPYFASPTAQLILEHFRNGTIVWSEYIYLLEKVCAPSIVLREIYKYFHIDLDQIASQGLPNPLTEDMIWEFIHQSDIYGVFMAADILNLIMDQTDSTPMWMFIDKYMETYDIYIYSDVEYFLMFEPNYLHALMEHHPDLLYSVINEYQYLINSDEYSDFFQDMIENWLEDVE